MKARVFYMNDGVIEGLTNSPIKAKLAADSASLETIRENQPRDGGFAYGK